jgi:hypothetical protein
MQKQTLEQKLEKIPFGALVEVTLKGKCGAEYKKSEIEIIPEYSTTNRSDEFGIKHVVGYNGSIQNKALDLRGCVNIRCPLEELDNEENLVLCLNPTIHYRNASREMHFQGEGYVKIPLTEIKSFQVLSRKRVGLRVVN